LAAASRAAGHWAALLVRYVVQASTIGDTVGRDFCIGTLPALAINGSAHLALTEIPEAVP
jgi:hypothetical protein